MSSRAPDPSLSSTRYVDGCLLASHLRGKPSLLPRTPSTYEGTCSWPPGTLKLARHPGARLFVGSGTVNDESRVLRQTLLSSVAHRIVGVKAHGTDCLEWITVVAGKRPGVDDHHLLAFRL